MDRTEDKKPKYSWGTGIPCSKDARESAAGGLTDLLVSWTCFLCASTTEGVARQDP